MIQRLPFRPLSIAILALGVVASVPVFGQSSEDIPGVTRRTRTTQPIAPTVSVPVTTPTPPPATPPPPVVVSTPPPVVAPPPPVTLPTTPIFLGSESNIGQLPTLESLFNRLNGQIGTFNNQSPIDLPSATFDGARQVSGNTPLPTSTQVVVSSSTAPVGGIDPVTGRRIRVTAPVVTPPPTVTGITIDVTGLSYVVFNLGNTNYHYYVGNLSGEQTFQGIAPLSSYGFLSSRSQVVGVPEGGSALLLLGGVLLVIGVVRYYQTRAS